MANRKELIEAMKVIKENCKLFQLDDFATNCTESCPIGNECTSYLSMDLLPEDWDLEESETE